MSDGWSPHGESDIVLRRRTHQFKEYPNIPLPKIVLYGFGVEGGVHCIQMSSKCSRIPMPYKGLHECLGVGSPLVLAKSRLFRIIRKN